MSFMYGKLDTVPAYWDFAIEGGAIGTRTLGVSIPQGFIFTKCVLLTFVTVTAGAGATIAFDAQIGQGAGAVVLPGFFAPAQPFGNFVSTAGSETLAGFDFNANPLIASQDNDVFINLTVAVAALTAGRIGIVLQVAQVDNLRS